MTADIRYREDTGWERRCPSCPTIHVGSAWWPLQLEYWDPHSMRVCRSCRKREEARRKRERLRTDPEYREAQVQKSRRYRAAVVAALRLKRHKHWLAIKADPERLARHRAKGRAASRAYRERRRIVS